MRLPQGLRRAGAQLLGRAMPVAEDGRPLQAAALPWRLRRDGDYEFLLVTSRSSGRWILPKGWPMRGRTLAQAAAQEAFEEAGVRGAVGEEPIGSFDHVKQPALGNPIDVVIRVYPLAVERELAQWPEESQRQRRWFRAGEVAQAVQSRPLRAMILAFADCQAGKQS